MNNLLILGAGLGAGTIALIAIAVIVVLIIMYFISTYNGLVNLREFVRNAMGNIAVQVESRWDALESLINATKKYSEHEAQVLTEITKARGGITQNSSAQEVEKDDQMFEQAMSRFNVVVENYPDLKASDLYTKTMDSINQYENNVRMSRMVYNDSVTKLNRQIQQFPSSIVAGMFGFTQESYFQNAASKADMPQW